ncbi:hypothetical protein [Treponema socranskii]|uniref:hypothetical protein n=1 Tax=Treponema socranskii TaxID=53419 RepID=UPI003D6F3F93
MKKIFFLGCIILSASVFASEPPPSYLESLDATEAANLVKKTCSETRRDIYNIYIASSNTRDTINCMDYAFMFFMKINNGLEPLRAVLIANDRINHLFIGLNVLGTWRFFDPKLGIYMEDVAKMYDFDYREEENYDVTYCVVQGYKTGFLDSALVRHARKHNKIR